MCHARDFFMICRAFMYLVALDRDVSFYCTVIKIAAKNAWKNRFEKKCSHAKKYRPMKFSSQIFQFLYLFTRVIKCLRKKFNSKHVISRNFEFSNIWKVPIVTFLTFLWIKEFFISKYGGKIGFYAKNRERKINISYRKPTWSPCLESTPLNITPLLDWSPGTSLSEQGISTFIGPSFSDLIVL